ncbi:ABC transporter permease [Pseudothioclava arenosa]|uniref:ABC transporter permease n=1 Tax=Pseudothioclava arenosa TaxID=1795308 RepID=A0A2A4CPV8_9RHOB|nr:ABC transporter permease subunit [Pseudothioclava arenosa]PCD76527.1 ABC transporter permease [Pseudothioclava arenosa]
MVLVAALMLVLIGLPVLAGLGVMLAQAWGQGWPDLPGLAVGLRLTLVTGVGATLLSLAVSIPLARWLWARGAARGWLAPFLAVPHAALGLGLAFLLAPSGWLVRLLSPWATGWNLPPQLVTVGDPWGVTLILGLLLKEAPFLILVTLVAAANLPVARIMAEGRSLGYRPGQVWLRLIWPQLYPSLRLPLFIVLAFSLSVVDMALLLGPSHPPTLAVQILRLFTAPDPALQGPAAMLSLLLLGVMAGAIGLWIGAERVLAALARRWLRRGVRGGWRLDAAPVLAVSGVALGAGAAGVLLLWSLATRWHFPAALPEGLSMAAWRAARWVAPAAETLLIGAAVILVALLLALIWLEAEDRSGRRLRLGAFIVLPLLVPQIGFLQGLAAGFLHLGLPPGRIAVIWAELLFVFPYVLLALAGPWRALDPQQVIAAASLGAGPWRRLWRIKLPLLAGPLATAAAIGFAVSAAQFLAVLLPGAGRVQVLATEAVALASGADRRLSALHGLLLAALPLIGYAAALWLPLWLWRDRAAMKGSA